MKHTDKTAIRALQRVDRLRAELREAEEKLKLEVRAFSQRRGYGIALRECQMRSQLTPIIQEKAA